MLLYIAGVVLFILFFIVPFLAPQFFLCALLFTGAISLSFLGGSRAFLGSVGGMNADALKLLATLLGGLIILGAHKQTINLLIKFKFHLFFLCYATLSLIWCQDTIFGLRMLAKLVAPLFLLLMFQISFVSQNSINKTEKWIFGGGILILILSVLANVFGFSTSGKVFLIPRFTIPYLNPNHFALYMLSLSLFALSSFYYQRKKCYFFFFLLFSMFCCISLSRIAIGSLFVSLSIFFFLISKNKPIAVITPILICFLTFYAFTSIDILKKRTFFHPEKISFSSVITKPEIFLDELSTSGRSKLWSLSLKKFFYGQPITGAGIGSTQHFFYTGYKGKIGLMHSEYIRMLCELGVVGCLLFTVLFFLYGLRMYKIWRKAKNTITKKYALSAMLCVISYMLVCITGNAIGYIFSFSMYAFAFIAFSFQCYQIETTGQSDY